GGGAARGWGAASVFDLFFALVVVAAPFLVLFQPAFGIARFVGVVLIEASVHPGLPRRFARIFRGDGRGKHGISGRLWCRCGGGSRRAGGRSGGGRIGAALGFAEIAPILPVESARGFCRLVLGAALLHRERLRRLPGRHNHRTGERHEACARRNLADRHGKPPWMSLERPSSAHSLRLRKSICSRSEWLKDELS